MHRDDHATRNIQARLEQCQASAQFLHERQSLDPLGRFLNPNQRKRLVDAVTDGQAEDMSEYWRYYSSHAGAQQSHDEFWTVQHENFLARLLTHDSNALLEAFTLNFGDIGPLPLTPFIEVFSAWSILGVSEFTSAFPDWHKTLSIPALQSLAVGLRSRVDTIFRACLMTQFSLFRLQNTSLASHYCRSSDGTQVMYKGFVASLLRPTEAAFILEEAPVLFRLVSTVLTDWLFATVEFCERVDADTPSLASHFAKESLELPLTNILFPAADRHNAGRSVVIAAYSSGSRIVYKPRSVAPEVAFYGLAQWLSSVLDGCLLYCPSSLDRGTHGWVDFVPHDDCRTPAGVDRFYERAGALLCLAYVVRGTDIHRENLIACGEFPVIIDLEAIFRPELNSFLSDTLLGLRPLEIAAEAIATTVLGCQMLPHWSQENEEYATDLGGLGIQLAPALMPEEVFYDINTDAMHCVTELRRETATANAPTCGGLVQPVTGYLEAVKRGFARAYRALQSHADYLSQADGPLASFADLRVRVLLRHTAGYVMLHKQALESPWLSNGVDYSIAFERLTRSAFAVSEAMRMCFLAIADDERLAMRRLDVPAFYADTSSKVLYGSQGKPLGGLIKCSGYEAVKKGLGRLSDRDLEHQLSLIQASVEVSGNPDAIGIVDCSGSGDGRMQSGYLGCARQIADALIAVSHRSDGIALWQGASLSRRTGKYEYGLIGYDFYCGATGLATFLATVGSITGESRFVECANEALRPLIHLLADKHHSRRVLLTLGVGGCVGVGSIIYGLSRVSELPAVADVGDLLRDTIVRARPELTPDGGRGGDVVHGAAGMVLALIKAFSVTRVHAAVDAALSWGDALLNELEKLRKTAFVIEEGFWPGMAHGFTGRALALAALHRASGVKRFVRGIEIALDLECRCYSKETGKWNTEASGSDASVSRWCRGSVGIAIGHLALERLCQCGNPKFIADGVDEVLCRANNRRLDVCCGLFGGVELLIAASKSRRDDALLTVGRKRVGGLVERLSGDALVNHAAHNPGMFKGIAGIGMTLLRLECPETVASVLSFD